MSQNISNMANFPPDSADSLHVQIEAMKLAFADAYRYIADPACMDISPDQLLSENYLAARAKLIDLERAKFPRFGLLYKFENTVVLKLISQ